MTLAIDYDILSSERELTAVLIPVLGSFFCSYIFSNLFALILSLIYLFKLIDRTFPYFADTYKNKMPEEIKRLYIY